MFAKGDKVILRYNWQDTMKYNKTYHLCIYCQNHPDQIYTVDLTGQSGKVYFKLDDVKFNGHETCGNTPNLFMAVMSTQECIDVIYQKLTESLVKPR
jgi:hypothetical protein